jgi:DNA-binding MarR family transcriptional regulator
VKHRKPQPWAPARQVEPRRCRVPSERSCPSRCDPALSRPRLRHSRIHRQPARKRQIVARGAEMTARQRHLYALSRDDIAEIKGLCETHAQRDVAALFRVHASTISRVVRGLSWRENGPADPRRSNAKLTPSAVQEIRRSTLSLAALARQHGVCTRSIFRALKGETWRTV